MVSIAEAVVDEGAVVVKALHALVAEVAVACVIWPQILTLNADVVQVVALLQDSFKQHYKVPSPRHITWVNQCQAVEKDGQ